jgi:hypothetical protein
MKRREVDFKKSMIPGVRLSSVLRHLLPLGLVIMGALLGALVFGQFDRYAAGIYLDETFFSTVDNLPLEESVHWRPNFGGGSMALRRNVQHDDMIISVHVITYLASLPDSELIQPARTIVDLRSWRQTETIRPSESLQESAEFNSRDLIVESNDRRTKMVVMYWFDIGGRRTESRSRAKMYGILNFLTFREDSSVIVLATKCEVSCDGKTDALRMLASRLFLDADGNYRSIVRRN